MSASTRDQVLNGESGDSSRKIIKAFAGSSALSAISAGVNLLSTVVVVRYCGTATYSEYMLDLAIVSIVLLVFEVIPSSYTVFKIQDDHAWKGGAAAQLFINILLGLAAMWIVASAGNVFFAYTHWIGLYVVCMAIKRFMDIWLQSQGRLVYLFAVDLTAAVLRIAFLTFFLLSGRSDNTIVWASLALAFFLAQVAWVLLNRSMTAALLKAVDVASWRVLIASSHKYPPYYLNVGLKRLREGIVPLLAERVLGSKDALAVFLLAYRGLAVALGQIRVMEAVFNHRAMVAFLKHATGQTKSLAAAVAQCASIVLGGVILISSGIDEVPWIELFLLSLLVWPITFSMAARAVAYADFHVTRVTWSNFANIFVLGLSVVILVSTKQVSAINFSLAMLLAEFAALFALRIARGTRGA